MITIVGMDGSPLSAAAGERLAGAGLVAGAERHLAAVPVPERAHRVVMGELDAALDAVTRFDGDAVVLASGDPGFFGIVRAVRDRRPDAELLVLPAVSSVAVAFARVGLPWDDAVVVSAHGRELRRAVNACRAHPKVAVLTGPGAGPAELGAALVGLPRRLVVVERAGAPDERVVPCRPATAAATRWADPNVVLVLAEPTSPAAGWVFPRRGVPAAWALPETAFEHRDSLVTKSEIRALALSRLGPGLGDLVWDVGTGSGAVAVECARFGAAVIAVDRDPVQCDRARRNAAVHGVAVEVVTGVAPAALGPLPDPDAVFVGGGGPAVVAACAARRPRTVVASLAALDRLGPVRDALRAAAYAVDGVFLHASRLAGLPGGTSRLAATNPVVLLWGERR